MKIDSKSVLNRISALLFGIFALWSFSEWMLRWSDDYSSALIWASIIMMCVLLLPPVLVHASMIFPWSKRDVGPAMYALYGFSVILLGIHINSRLFVKDVNKYIAGYGTVLGPYGLFAYLYLAVFGLLALLLLMVRYTKTKSKIAMHQIRLVIIAFSISYLFVFFTGLVPYILGNPDEYPWTTPSFLIMGSVLTYAIWKYHLFLPEPEKEKDGDGKLAQGVFVLPRNEAIVMFYEMVNSGSRGMCITSRDPGTVKEEMSLESVPVVGLSEIDHKVDLTDEKGKDMVPFIISDILSQSGTAILLDGLDSVMNPDELKELINDLKSMELKGNSVLISLEKQIGV